MSVGMPTHYQLRVEHISHEVSRLPRDAKSTVVLLGDAHVEPNPIKKLAGVPVINMGITEDHLGVSECAAIKDRLWLLPMARPGHIIIMAGLNDLREGKSPLDVENCVRELVGVLRRAAPEAKIHIATIPPTRDKYARLLRNVAITNGILEELAETLGVDYLDLFAPLEDDEGLLAQDCTSDGYYLNDTGFDRVNDMLERHLTRGDHY